MQYIDCFRKSVLVFWVGRALQDGKESKTVDLTTFMLGQMIMGKANDPTLRAGLLAVVDFPKKMHIFLVLYYVGYLKF